MFNISKSEIGELSKEFAHLTENRVKIIAANSTKKTLRGLKNELRAANDEFAAIANQPRIKVITIEIEWQDTKNYGLCPRATAHWVAIDGTTGATSAYAKGCGYDKLSTVVANCLNQVAKGMLWSKRHTHLRVPYGISNIKDNDFPPYFMGGVGISCYYDIAKFLGGKLEHVASANSYDKFVFTFSAK